MVRDPLRGAWLASRLQPAHVRVYARLRSTNLTTIKLLEQRLLVAPALVLAARQTAGRGQRRNQWWSDGGSLCATFVLPADPVLPIGQIPLRAGLAVATALAHYAPAATVQLKWPNDLLLGGKKVAGLLCARVHDQDVIGIGINLRTDLRHAPADVQARATSLAHVTRRLPRRDELAAALWHELHAWRVPAADWHATYQRLHALHDLPIRLTTDDGLLSGLCRGVDFHGRLLLLDAGGAITPIANATVERA